MVTLTVDGKQVTVEEGTTILKAAEKLGIEIPTFCYHDKLEAVGACRMCLVEVEKMWKLQVACATTVSEGMAVKTDTPQVKAARKGVLEFLLINHPLDCPVCDKGGECELQNLVFKYGSDTSRYTEEKRRFIVDPKSKYDDLSIGPQIVRNMNRCILCRKCVRFLNEIAGETDLGTFGRAAKSEINVLPDVPLDNPYSGNVVEICPVGALTSKSFRYKTRVWQTEVTPTICPHCGDGCNINLWTKDDKIYRVTSRRNDHVDEGFLCDKGRFGFEFVNRPDRLTQPLVRKNGRLLPASWDEAVEFTASTLKSLKQMYGADSLAGIGSSKLTNEESYLFQKFVRVALGTNNIDHRVGMRYPQPLPRYKGKGKFYWTMNNSISDIDKAGLVFVLGCDLLREHPIITLRVMTSTRNGNALWVANRQSTSLKRFARHEFVYRSETEFELVSGLLREIVRGQLLDAARSGLSENETARLKRRLEELEGEQVLQTTGISDDRIRILAQAMREAETLLILCGKDVADHRNSLKILSVLYELLELTGHQNRKESGLNLLWEGCNSQGAQDCGVFLNRLPGYQDILDKDSRARVEEVWGAPVPGVPGLDVEYMLKNASEGKLKAIYLVGADPVSEYPDENSAREAMKKLDFVVAQDIFLTESAKLAHVVLPGASFAEKDGTFTSVEGRIQRIRRAFEPLDNSRADWYIICMLAQAMGYNFDYASPVEIFEELTKISPIHEGISWADLGETGKRWQTV